MLAKGVKSAGEQIVVEAEEIAVHVKGLEPPAYEPRGSFSMGLAYATSDRGACHMRAWAIGGDVFGDRDPYTAQRGHAEAVVHEQNLRSLVPDSLITCAFTGYNLDDARKWLSSLEYQVDPSALETTGERIWNLTHLFNVREGFSRKEDRLPIRMEEPLKRGGRLPAMYLLERNLRKCWIGITRNETGIKTENPSLRK